MSEMNTTYNLDDLFGQMENETKLTSTLYYPKKGEQLILALLPPLQYNGKFKLSLPIETEYNGKKGQQFIVRFLMFDLVGGKPDTSNPKYVGIPLAPTLVAQLVKYHKGDYQLAQQTCHFLELTKVDKTVITPRPTVKTIPDEIWTPGLTQPTWEELLQAHLDMKTAQANKQGSTKENKEDTPW